ncbi:MAG: hypothetical protein IJX97_01940 [Clostridia bacterium]|nr:hypothetical protein [Clostridia bacterium]MBQ8302292.1 hypothetical protein [Clostridia bacterium]
MDKNIAQRVLESFCTFSIGESQGVLDSFASLPGAVKHYDRKLENFVYVPGRREDRVLLVAHADTVWNTHYRFEEYSQTLLRKTRDGKTVYVGKDPSCGIGADDRAGCAILWMLRNSGHSLLVLDGEEHGQIGANHIRLNYPELYDELNRHAYAIQFDRRNAREYKVYDLPVSDEFIEFIEKKTGYVSAGTNARTDIVALCRDICGVNLSVGYYNEHKSDEYLVFEEWFDTLEMAEKLLSEPQKKFPLEKRDFF